MAIRIKGKIWKVGNGYVVTIPKAFMTAGVFEVGQELSMEASTTNGSASLNSVDGPDGNWYSFSRSCLYGLLNAPFDSVFFPKNNKYSGGFALYAV